MILTPTLKLEKAMTEATTYGEWRDAAQAHDRESGKQAWRDSDDSKHFDHASIRDRLTRLSLLWKEQDSKALLYTLNEGIHGNMDGMGDERLYRKAKFGTKRLIEDYVAAVANALDYLASAKVRSISRDDKLDFFKRAQHCYGRSALLMSGSGAFLYFHVGVVKALWQEGVLPHIISGSSGGSIVGALVCTHKDADLGPLFAPEQLYKEPLAAAGIAKRLTGEQVRARIEEIIPDLTFQEAYELTGRRLNVSVAPAEKHQNSRLLNAIASPNVYIREAVLASCAVPGVYPPVMLMAKDHRGRRVPYLPDRKWVDGSVTNDLPSKRLARLYGVNHHIVSQANPLISPFAIDMKQANTPIAAIRHAAIATTKAWINANMAIMQRPLSWFPPLNSVANITLSVINQDYGGDINIVRPPKLWSPSKMLSDLNLAEIKELIADGERMSWPKIEMVRTQTRISQTLETILQAHGTKLASDTEAPAQRAVKRKLAA